MDRLLSEQAVIDVINGCLINRQTVIDRIKAIPSAEPKWIPCSERLPQEDDYKPSYEVCDGAVLWTNEDGLVGEGYYYESTKTWSDIEDNPVSVTAWMPLPPCYEPQESEG